MRKKAALKIKMAKWSETANTEENEEYSMTIICV